ncbi:MAG: heavy metal translocating P-type ATPase [Aquifex sp.]|nr:MAG: heavy metal translocating P-type ATPase [Aquifex sp.]
MHNTSHQVHHTIHSEHPKREHKRHHDVDEIKLKAIITTLLSIPVVILSEGIRDFLKIPDIPFSNYLVLILSTVVFIYGGSFFIKGSVLEIKKRKPGMMTLVALAITVAYVYSLFAFFSGRASFFWEITTLIAIMLWGHWIEMKSVLGAGRALEELVKLMPTKANLIKGKEIIEVPVSSLKPGDKVLVKPGEKIPADGVVVEGITYVDESLLTGESKPVPKKVGDKVIAGAVNLEGSLKVQVEKTGEDSYLSQVMKLIKEAQESKTELQNLADKAAFYLTIIAIIAGGLSFTIWQFISGNTAFAVERAITVMVISCPHALGLAIPLVVSISTSYSAKKGILIRNRLALERAKDVNVIVFDKTGTLTEGKFGISKIINSIDKKEFLKIVASVEGYSEHSLAKAVVDYAVENGIHPESVQDFKAFPGKGIYARFEGKEIFIGNIDFLREKEVKLKEEILRKSEEVLSKGNTVIFVAVDRELVGAIALSDKIRKESFEAIRELKRMGKKIIMITGDDEKVAENVAKELKIDEFFARVLPHEKSQKIKELQERGFKVAMVGDGINDAPALVQADIGIAIGSGTDVAIESADIILVKNDPRNVVDVIRLSELTVKKMYQNLFWALGYNVITIPLAMGLGAPIGIVLKPAIGAVFMSASTVIVALNAMLMKRELI